MVSLSLPFPSPSPTNLGDCKQHVAAEWHRHGAAMRALDAPGRARAWNRAYDSHQRAGRRLDRLRGA